MEVNTKMEATTNCPICLEMFTDPKILPCIHTFCAKCLEATARKANKKPGDHMECPSCRERFPIPHEGFAELQKNFFVEKLVTLTKILEMNDGPCNACMVGEESSSATKASPITSYCCNCSLKLCIDCSKHHKKGKLTKSHKLVVIDNQPITAERMEILASGQCEHHQDEELKVYCIDCKTIICSLCYIESHQNHNRSDIKIASHDHRKKLFEDIGVLSTCIDSVRRRERKLEERAREIAAKIGALKTEVEKRRLELKRLVDKQAVVLVEQLNSLRETQLKDTEKEGEDIARHNKCLESLKSYVCEFAEKATAADISQAVNSIRGRATELKETTYNITESQLSPINISFWETDFQEFLRSDRCNILGIIQEKCATSKETAIGKNAEETKGLKITIEQLKCEAETEKLKIQKYQGSLNAINQELVRERANKKRWIMKEKNLSEIVRQLEQELAHLKQTTPKVQKQLDDERRKTQSLDSELKKCLQEEREFNQEKNSFASKEWHLKKIIEQSTRQEKEAIQTINNLKQDIALQQTLCNSLKAEQRALQEQAEQKEHFALMEHNKDREKIQELEEKLTERNNERHTFQKRQSELEKLLYEERTGNKTSSGEPPSQDSGVVKGRFKAIKFLSIAIKKGFPLLLIIGFFYLIGANSGQILFLLVIFVSFFCRIAVF